MSTSEIRRARPLLGTLVEIAAHGPDAEAAVAAAFRAVEQVHALMSYHDPASDLSRLNREAAARPVTIDPWTWRVLAAARDFSAASDGLFDITVAPALTRLGYLPRHEDFPRACGHADWRCIELLPRHQVRFARPLHIDLGGIAKGFAVDKAIEALQAGGVTRARVNAGGDLRRFGAGIEPLHVRHPDAPAVLLPLAELQDGAAATSAGYFAPRQRGGRQVSPHIHPHTGQALASGASATVLAPDCMTADALTKIVLADCPAALPVLERYGARAILLDRDSHTGAWRMLDSTHQERRCA
jgi:thiamine biosynthesis lipoprotein